MTQEHAKYDQEVIYGTTYDTYIYIYRKFTANSSMWGSLRLAPINCLLDIHPPCTDWYIPGLECSLSQAPPQLFVAYCT